MQNPGFDVVVITGGFDPLHSGHLSYIKAAADLGQILVVGVNSDEWLTRKKSRSFMPFTERLAIIKEIKYVNHAIGFDDTDGSGKDAIRWARKQFPDSKIIFANGGDRTETNIPEMDIEDDNIEFIFGVGGTNKKNSSSWILEEWKAPKTLRSWGYYRILHEYGSAVKLKELTVEPGKYLSMQRHEHRAEFWFVAEGVASVYTVNSSTDVEMVGMYKEHQYMHIKTGAWHQLVNETDKPLKLIEIQYGTNCIEEDITRK
jgi:D-beta-D-heptose 7-phosphate kinase/D-beta-D-heptose 1-phosphate adenosyltransferase